MTTLFKLLVRVETSSSKLQPLDISDKSPETDADHWCQGFEMGAELCAN